MLRIGFLLNDSFLKDVSQYYVFSRSSSSHCFRFQRPAIRYHRISSGETNCCYLLPEGMVKATLSGTTSYLSVGSKLDKHTLNKSVVEPNVGES